jgi:tripartite-type tricarboxylate transporter receptor subunit TctC
LQIVGFANLSLPGAQPVTIQRRRFLRLAGSVAIFPITTGISLAQTYPSRSVRIIVATAAGGSSDIAARLIAQWLTERLGQSFFVENRPGGNNNIGTEAAARSRADGYTLFWANSVNTINVSLYEKLNYNFIADFTPVVHVIRSPLLMVHPSVPARTVPEFIAYATANPDKISMGSGGHGSSGHMAGELFKLETGVRMVHLPYRGESLAMTDLLGGQVQVLFATTGSAIEYARAGMVRVLAVTSRVRLDTMPDVPALAEFLPDFADVGGWSGLCVPKGTPAEIVALLNEEINVAIAEPKIRQRVADMGSTSPGGSPADFAKFIADETERWSKVVKFAGIKAD